jgi:Tfp pilus assembly protein PilZ
MTDMKDINWLTSFLGKKMTGGDRKEIRYDTAHPGTEDAAPRYAQKRRYPRFLVESMDIRSQMIFAESIQLSNISVGGACMITKTPLKIGNNILIRINRDRIRRPLLGTIIWKNLKEGISFGDDTGPALYRVGVQFRKVAPETLIQVKDFMRISGVPEETSHVDNDKQLSLRYAVIADEQAIMNYPTTFTVKRISMGGMLVVTNCRLKVEQKYRMALFLPNESSRLSFTGRVASQIPNQGGLMSFETGIEFCDLADRQIKLLKRFIASLLWKPES